MTWVYVILETEQRESKKERSKYDRSISLIEREISKDFESELQAAIVSPLFPCFYICLVLQTNGGSAWCWVETIISNYIWSLL